MALCQIGTIGYKQEDGEYNTYPLLMEETEELQEASKQLFDNACEMFIRDISNFEQSKLICEN